jgi:hypothetical protein
MDWNWLWQGIVSNWVAALAIVGGGLLITYLKTKGSKWANGLLYGVGGATCIAVLLFALKGRAVFSKEKPEVTGENIEANMKVWADEYGLGVTRAPSPPPDSFFAYGVTLANSNQLLIFRSKAKPKQLQLQVIMSFSQEHQTTFAKLSKEQSANFMQEIVLELARAKIGYTISTAIPIVQGTQVSPFSPQMQITIMKTLPLSGTLDEDMFVRGVDEMDSAISMVRSATELAFKHNSEPQPKEPTKKETAGKKK